jgi:hypothetical protein
MLRAQPMSLEDHLAPFRANIIGIDQGPGHEI